MVKVKNLLESTLWTGGGCRCWWESWTGTKTAGDGETQERTWMYMSPRMEDFLEGHKIGTDGWGEDEGVETGESDWADLEEALLGLGVLVDFGGSFEE